MEEIRGKGYEIIVEDGLTSTRWDPEEKRLYTSRALLEADVKLSVLGERIAGLLLPPVTTSSPDLEKLVKTYRERVVAEEAAELVYKLGPLAVHADVDVAYFPIARARALWRLIGCWLKLDLGELREAYRAPARVAGSVRSDTVSIKPCRYNDYLSSRLKKMQLATAGWVAGIAKFLNINGGYSVLLCEDPGEPPDPYQLIRLPEGSYIGDCQSPESIAARHTGGEASCKRGAWASSTYICQGPLGTVSVKEYLGATAKWLPAYVVSYSAVNYLLKPKSRLYNECKYFRELRRIIETPRVLSICGDAVGGLMARSYIEGTPLMKLEDGEAWRMTGRALAKIHGEGYVLGDPNPGNFIIEGGRVGLIDAEQARRFTYKGAAWDLIVFVYYPLLFGKKLDPLVEGVRGYLDSVDPGVREGVLKHLKGRKIWFGLSLLPVQYVKAREVFREAGVELT